MVTIVQGFRRVSKDLAHLVEENTVERLCNEVGHTWRKRLPEVHVLAIG